MSRHHTAKAGLLMGRGERKRKLHTNGESRGSKIHHVEREREDSDMGNPNRVTIRSGMEPHHPASSIFVAAVAASRSVGILFSASRGRKRESTKRSGPM